MTSNSSYPVIIDTDPGIDDVLALYFALGSPQIDIKAITLVFGNSEINNIKRNLATLFDVIDKEIEYLKIASPLNNQIDPQQWEKERKTLLNRFEWSKPLVAIGAEKPIRNEEFLGTNFHGPDGLGQVHTTHPHYTPKNWEDFKSNRYTMSSRSSADEILYQLQNSPPFTITIIGLGPLTNIALAYEKDKYTFSRVKQVICLGGAIDCPGNTTPCAEFNFQADADAASILAEATKGFSPLETVQNKIERLNRKEILPIHFTVLPTDVTSKVLLSGEVFTKCITSLNTPLSIFTSVFVNYAFKQMQKSGINGMEMHDPVTIAFAIDILSNKSQAYNSEFVDMKVEYKGIYTRGMTIVDKRKKNPSKYYGRVWSINNANNVEVVYSYEHKSFISNFFKIVFNVDYSS